MSLASKTFIFQELFKSFDAFEGILAFFLLVLDNVFRGFLEELWGVELGLYCTEEIFVMGEFFLKVLLRRSFLNRNFRDMKFAFIYYKGSALGGGGVVGLDSAKVGLFCKIESERLEPCGKRAFCRQ